MAQVEDSYSPPLGAAPLRRWTRTDAYATGATRATYAGADWEALPGLRLLCLVSALVSYMLWMALEKSGKPAPPWLEPGLIASAVVSAAVAAGLTAFVQLRMATRLRRGEVVVRTWARPASALKPGHLITLLDERQIHGWEHQLRREGQGEPRRDRPTVRSRSAGWLRGRTQPRAP